MVEQEQQINPALEPVEPVSPATQCTLCPIGSPAQCSHCPYGRNGQSAGEAVEPLVDGQPAQEFRFMMGGTDDEADDDPQARAARADRFDPGGDFSAGNHDSDFDPLLLAAAPNSLRDDILGHLRGIARSAKEIRIAEYLVDSLDEHGYLKIDASEAQMLLDIDSEELDAAVARLQACEPAGIGARNLQECLLLQLEFRRELQGAERYDSVAE